MRFHGAATNLDKLGIAEELLDKILAEVATP
jgi:hypothetical protein